jgi:hypothetical protein
MHRDIKVIKSEIEGEVIYKSVVTDGSGSAELEIDVCDERIVDKISLMFGYIKGFLEMIYVQATHEPESLEPAIILEMGNRLIETYDAKVADLFQHLEAKVGEISIVEARRGNGHIDEGKILDVLCKRVSDHE